MNDNHTPDACAAIQPLLFAAIEGEIDRDERLAVHAHLAICDRCRSWERGERALTALLTESNDAAPRRTRGFGAPSRWAVLAVAALALFLVTLPTATARGSIVERRLGTDRSWEVASERSFEDDHVVDVPAAASASVRLDDVRLDAVGPARFTLAAKAGTWRIEVERGSVVATVGAGASLETAGGASVGAGTWTLSPNAVARIPADGDDAGATSGDLTIDELDARLTDGMAHFGRALPSFYADETAEQRRHLLDAERLLRQVVDAENATPYMRRRALFYLAATLGRQGRDADSYEYETLYIEEFPDGEEASLVRHYMACHLLRVGRRDEATALFQRVVEDEDASPLGSAAAGYLESMKPGGSNSAEALQQRDDRDARAGQGVDPWGNAAQAMGDTRGAYLVVRVGLASANAEHAGFISAAAAARAFHGAEVWDWDGEDFEALGAELRRVDPENVLFVLTPDRLDLVLHRRVLLLGAEIDDDRFMDFAFGYLTAEDGAACERLWGRVERVHRRGTLAGTWWQASVAVLDRSFCSKNGAPSVAVASGFQGPHYYYGLSDPEKRSYVQRSLETMRSASVIEITGCGDPQGIWLFDDHRNVERDKHWDYDPERVGEDPDGSMPRLMASQFREVELDAPVLWSGTCHSGAVRRVYVEGDIVSTFGRTENATVHLLEPESSLALSWLEAGAASLLVPLGANHGMSVSMEVDFALRNGASLGETLKSTYDDVLFASGDRLVLDLPVEGQPHGHGEDVMHGGGSNRILIGDPALRPFRPVEGIAERVAIEATDAGARVTIVRADGWQPRAWDMFGNDRQRDYRALTRVDLTALGMDDLADPTVRVRATAPDGTPMGYEMQRSAIEDHQGRRYLHLQAGGTRADLDRKAATIVFTVER